jgi:hypothetical protein
MTALNISALRLAGNSDQAQLLSEFLMNATQGARLRK